MVISLTPMVKRVPKAILSKPSFSVKDASLATSQLRWCWANDADREMCQRERKFLRVVG